MGVAKRQLSQGKAKPKFDVSGLHELQLKLNKLTKFCAKSDKVAKAIHKKHAHNMSRALKRRIKPARKDILVTSKDRRSPTLVERGTYKRSIGFWKPRNAHQEHVYMVGAKTGGKVPARKDAWFQLIVEQDKQFIRGNNRHAGAIEAFLKEAVPKMQRKLVEDYKKHLRKLAK